MKWNNADAALVNELTEVCELNPWICKGGTVFEDDPLMDEEYEFQFCQVDTIEELEEFFRHGNWAVRQGVVYGDLAFVNQINGGDEWWAMKRFDFWLAFDSITFEPMIKRGEFHSYLSTLKAATFEQCKNGTYGGEPTAEEVEAMEIVFGIPQLPVVFTRAVNEASTNAQFAEFKLNSLQRFLNRDWGEISGAGKDENDRNPNYQLAGYDLPPEVEIRGESRLWIRNDGMAITVLFPSDY